jgi:quercetin dioxygenase-like cupin family protein
MKPYSQIEYDGSLYREFDIEVPIDELVWHRDKQDRYVEIIEGTDWCFQLDNELPILLKKGQVLFIPKETYHRIIKGIDTLKIRIEEK